MIPSVAISRNGTKAILVYKIDDQWFSIPNYDAQGLRVYVKLDPRNNDTWIQLRQNIDDYTPDDGLGWGVSFREALPDIILLAFGIYLDNNNIPQTPTDRRMAVEISLDYNLYNKKNFISVSDDEIIKYISDKLYWSWRFRLPEAKFSISDSYRLGIPLSDIPHLALLGDGQLWDRREEYIFKPRQELIVKYNLPKSSINISWENRELKILQTILGYENQGICPQFDNLVNDIGLERKIIEIGLKALIDGSYVTGLDATTFGGFNYLELRLLPKGRQMVSQWPKEPKSIIFEKNNLEKDWDFFISHASEDKDEIARPLAEALLNAGYKVWYDEMTLVLGDSLRRSIDKGLSKSKYGVVILSQNFFNKEWPQKELDGLVAREVQGVKVILPVWHKVTKEEIIKYSPTLADKLGVSTSNGLQNVVNEIKKAIQI